MKKILIAVMTVLSVFGCSGIKEKPQAPNSVIVKEPEQIELKFKIVVDVFEATQMGGGFGQPEIQILNLNDEPVIVHSISVNRKKARTRIYHAGGGNLGHDGGKSLPLELHFGQAVYIGYDFEPVIEMKIITDQGEFITQNIIVRRTRPTGSPGVRSYR